MPTPQLPSPSLHTTIQHTPRATLLQPLLRGSQRSAQTVRITSFSSLLLLGPRRWPLRDLSPGICRKVGSNILLSTISCIFSARTFQYMVESANFATDPLCGGHGAVHGGERVLRRARHGAILSLWVERRRLWRLRPIHWDRHGDAHPAEGGRRRAGGGRRRVGEWLSGRGRRRCCWPELTRSATPPAVPSRRPSSPEPFPGTAAIFPSRLRRHYSGQICRKEEEEGHGRGEVCPLARQARGRGDPRSVFTFRRTTHFAQADPH